MESLATGEDIADSVWDGLESFKLGGKHDAQAISSLLASFAIPLLFAAAAHAFTSHDKAKMRNSSLALECALGSTAGSDYLNAERSQLIQLCLAGMQSDMQELQLQTVKVVKALALHQPEDRPQRCHTLVATPLLPELIQLVASKAITTGEAASSTLLGIVRESSSPGDVVTVLTALREACSSADINTKGLLRYADLITNIAGLSSEGFQAGIATGALSVVLELADRGDDLLVQLNAFELLERIAGCEDGATFLQSKIQHLLELGQGHGPGEESSDPTLRSAAIQLLSKILSNARPGPALDPAIPSFLQAVLLHLRGGEGAQLAALDALTAFAAKRDEVLAAALSQRELAEAWLSLRKPNTDMKAVVLKSLARVLGAPEKESSEPVISPAAVERSNLCRLAWDTFGEINGGPTPMPLLMACLKQPIPEMKHAACELLCCAAHQTGGWGIRALFAHAGVLEYLCSTDVAVGKAEAEWKFCVVEAVMLCPDKAILGAELLGKLEAVLKRGPFPVPQQQRSWVEAENM
ncbi:unnamed protein product [Chrysoparadoxa australica]